MSSASTATRPAEEVKIDFNEHKAAQHGKSAVAERLEKESEEIKKKRESLSKEDVDKELKQAEDRRQKELADKVEKAKKLEGSKGNVDPNASKDAPPAGKELIYSPTGQQAAAQK